MSHAPTGNFNFCCKKLASGGIYTYSLQERQRAASDRVATDYAAIHEKKGLKGMTAQEAAYLEEWIIVKVRNGTKLTVLEERFVRERGLSAAAAIRGRR